MFEITLGIMATGASELATLNGKWVTAGCCAGAK